MIKKVIVSDETKETEVVKKSETVEAVFFNDEEVFDLGVNEEEFNVISTENEEKEVNKDVIDK